MILRILLIVTLKIIFQCIIKKLILFLIWMIKNSMMNNFYFKHNVPIEIKYK